MTCSAYAAMITPSTSWCGIALHEEVVLEGGRLGLVAVHDEVGDRALAQHRPLAPGRETGAAASEQRRLVDLGRTASGVIVSALRSAVVPTGREVARQRVRVVEPEPRR